LNGFVVVVVVAVELFQNVNPAKKILIGFDLNIISVSIAPCLASYFGIFFIR
jgi:hypothetical protein